MRAVLGIDTSAYTCSCALVDLDKQLLASRRSTLPVPLGERGLRQSEAVFSHMRLLPGLLKELRTSCPAELVALCASAKPVDAQDSYMPVFQVGLFFAQTCAAALGIPCYESTHQRGHMAAAAMGLQLPRSYLTLHLSGGTTDLLLSDGEELRPMGKSKDLHAGQLIDRLGVSLGLPFPAGPGLEALAMLAQPMGRYKTSPDGMDCHLSGIEAQAKRDLAAAALMPHQLAAEVFDALARTTASMLHAAEEASGIQDALVFGGIASSSLMRSLMSEALASKGSKLKLHFGAPELSGDNAAGIALIGADRYLQHKSEGGQDGNIA